MGIPRFLFYIITVAAFLSPDPAVATPWRFIATCDSRGYENGINAQILGEIAQEAVDKHAEFIVFPGDLVHGITPSPQGFEDQLLAWVDAMGPAYDAGVGVYPARGNHELGDVWSYYPYGGTGKLDINDNHVIRWLNVFGSDARPEQKLPANGPDSEKYMTYAIEHRNAVVLMLDQYAGYDHGFVHYVNQQWVDATLADNTRPHIFAAGHEEAFRTRHPDCLDYEVEKRDAFWKSLADAGARAYFDGHDHYYDHARIDDGDGNPDNDVHQLIIATAGAPFYSFTPPYPGNNSHYLPVQLYHVRAYGYILVEIDGPAATLTWMQRSTNDSLMPAEYRPEEAWGYTVRPGPIVLAPDGGENLAVGVDTAITYKTMDGANVQSVVLEYSTDGSETWAYIDTTSNTGRYDWTVPPADSNQCLIRISDSADPAVSDVSNRPFTIFNCNRQLPGDVNGDCYIDLRDLAILMENYLQCANPFDPSCAD